MKSLQAALQALSFDPALARLAATADRAEVTRLAAWLAERDPYGERGALERALAALPAPPELVPRHVEHKLWCAWRQAAWTSGLAEPLPVRCESLEWLRETEGYPTVLVAPMTTAAPDALHAISSLAPAERPCVVFGEEMDSFEPAAGWPEIATGAAAEAVPRIREALAAKGFFCTYADFVYDGRGAQQLNLFGLPRPVSTGFLNLAAGDGTMLLPLVALRRGEGIEVVLEEPLQIALEKDLRDDPAAARQLVAPIVANVLEGLIRRAPEQWLLLPTLTFESPEMVRLSDPGRAPATG